MSAPRTGRGDRLALLRWLRQRCLKSLCGKAIHSGRIAARRGNVAADIRFCRSSIGGANGPVHGVDNAIACEAEQGDYR
jgi:hypothetical protein